MFSVEVSAYKVMSGGTFDRNFIEIWEDYFGGWWGVGCTQGNFTGNLDTDSEGFERGGYWLGCIISGDAVVDGYEDASSV